ncbi:polymeric immunoglobulin receptor-like [Sebastes umbrosus]|uniref:polymeric immunoglobulin receptor-like n=1 Tax=Sebastes umbrosus TaxID=72105 RepID=UPI00189CCC4A|nr:polymeric immunoglobulin receptor-like [Sebastes umbrosus]
MALHLRVLLLITGLTGIHSITTVSKVSVEARDSISIPCLYASQYINHVKYLCKGYYWSSCSYAVKTNQRNSGRFSISDDKSRGIFTVTIKDVTDKDTADYWCAVEIDGGSDVGEKFHLSVTKGTPSLYVDHQEITGFKGDNITINCHYRYSGEIAWCRLGSSCVTMSSGSIDGTRVTSNASIPNVFTVTMSGLRTESSGWYWCVKGDLQMPVHVTVIEQPITDRAPTTGQSEQHSVSVELKRFIISLSVLIFIVMVALFIWFMLKRHKQTKATSSAMTAAEEEVTYSNVEHIRKTSSQKSHAESDVDVTYSSVVTTRPQRVRRVEANDENVTYSTLA